MTNLKMKINIKQKIFVSLLIILGLYFIWFIKDKVTCETFTIFGIDCESIKWSPIIFYETLLISILILFLLTTLIFLRSIQKKNKSLTDERNQKDLFEKNLKESDEKLQDIFNTMTEGLALNELIIGQDGKIVDSKIIEVNHAFENMVGLSKSAIIGHNLTELFPDLSNLNESWFNNLLKGRTTRAQLYNAEKDTWNYISVYKPVNYKFVATFFDVTDLKNTEKELIKAKEKADENVKLKNNFFATLDHEIRTPMNAILGCVYYVLNYPNLSHAEQQDCIKLIGETSNKMLDDWRYFRWMAMMDSERCISMIESGQIDIELEKTNFNELVKFIDRFFLEYDGKKLIKPRLIIGDDQPNLIIKTDPWKVLSIFSNLIKHVFKFSNTELIEFGFNIKDRFVECFVKYKGIGISETQQQTIFDNLILTETGKYINKQGDGLELSISKSFVGMLGGKIWMESNIGEGSTIYFTLPLNKY